MTEAANSNVSGPLQTTAFMAAALHPMLCHMPGVTEYVKESSWDLVRDHAIELEPNLTSSSRPVAITIYYCKGKSTHYSGPTAILEIIKDIDLFGSDPCP
jgi:hypothetical protein